MGDREFFDLLFQQWSRTTEATYWRPESTDTGFTVFAVQADDTRTVVAEGLTEVDADWITAVHGCFGDVVRRTLAALDEADRCDQDRDERETRIAELELQVMAMRKELNARP